MPKHGFAVLVFFLFSIKDICMLEKNGYVAKKVSEYDQEIPQSETADKTWMEPFWNSGSVQYQLLMRVIFVIQIYTL